MSHLKQQDYPESVINKLLQITLENSSFAYLAIDDNGNLINQGGDIDSLELPDWSVQDNILDDALFLAGLIPMSTDYEVISSLHLTDTIIVDAHLFQDNELIWIILVNKTNNIEWQNLARQKTNELRLLQSELAALQNHSPEERKINHNDYFEPLQIMAFRLLNDGAFELIKPVSKCFSQVYPEAFKNPGSLLPQDKFPFIDNFLIDAKQLWDLGIDNQRIYSGPWIETLPDGSETALDATAINWKGDKLLFIGKKDISYQQDRDFLQIGREGVLMKNILEQEVRKRTQEIRAREEEIALRLICAADSRDDGETGSHIRRLGLYSELMAKHLNWRQDRVEEIRVAAPMHDIGKIGIPDHILKKPGKLTEEEFEIMKSHAEIGAKILSNSNSGLVQMASEISLGHHEKWDGSGYPLGLSGKNIPQSARIVAILDVFDALIHKRVYKKELSIDEALNIMTEGRGSHFDPVLFDLFIDLKNEMAEISKNFDDPLCVELKQTDSGKR